MGPDDLTHPLSRTIRVAATLRGRVEPFRWLRNAVRARDPARIPSTFDETVLA